MYLYVYLQINIDSLSHLYKLGYYENAQNAFLLHMEGA